MKTYFDQWIKIIIGCCALFLSSGVSVIPCIGSVQHVTHKISNESNDALLQFRSGDHVLGFHADHVLLVGMGYALIEKFVDPHEVKPIVSDTESTTSPSLTNGNSTFRRVGYHDLWDGISVQYDVTVDGLAESTYIVSPNANPENIQLQYNAPYSIETDGTLLFKHPTEKGWFTQTAPIAWQQINGKRLMVEVAFEKRKNDVLGFQLKNYNQNYPINIDPVYQWHTFYGGNGNNRGFAIAVDGDGNIIVAGSSSENWHGDGETAPLRAASGIYNITILKLDAKGTYQWHTFYGAGSVDHCNALAVDTKGNIYLTGESQGTWLGDNNEQPLHAYTGYSDISVLKLDTNGIYKWHTFYGGTSFDNGYSIISDKDDNIYIAGVGSDPWQVDGNTAPIHPHSGFTDMAVFKLDTNGTYQWHTFYGSAGHEFAAALTIDRNDKIFVTGNSAGTWLGDNSTSPLHPMSSGSSTDISILKLDLDGTYQWHTFYGGSTGGDLGTSIATDQKGNIYVAGVSTELWQGDNNTDPLHAFTGGGEDLAVLKLDSSGSYQWHTFYSDGDEPDPSIAVDSKGSVFLTGQMKSWLGDNDTPPIRENSGLLDIVLLNLDTNGAYQYHSFYGGSGYDMGEAITIDSKDNLFIAGFGKLTWQGDDDTSPIHDHADDYDMIVMKFLADNKFPWPIFLPAMTGSK